MKILLSRTDRIGDLILSTPAIATVRASFPEAHVTMVTSPYNHVVMERNDDVDEVVDLPSEVKPSAFGARFRGYDLAIALAPRAADLQVAGGSGARVRAGYTYVRRFIARLTARLYLNRVMVSEADPELSERDPNRFVRHEVDQLLDLVAKAGALSRVPRLRLDLTDADRALVSRLPPHPVVFHLGQRWFTSGSTLASTIELIRAISALGAPVVVSCPDESAAEGDAIEQAGVADAVVRGLPFFAWAALFERAQCVVTVDTGATHVASAMRRPTLVAFEHRYFRLNSQEWAPYGVPSVLVRKPETDDDASLARFRDEVLRGVTKLIDA